jgi:hypothetical protein
MSWIWRFLSEKFPASLKKTKNEFKAPLKKRLRRDLKPKSSMLNK